MANNPAPASMLYLKIGKISIPVHPVATHFPNALLPTAALFFFGYIVAKIAGIGIADNLEVASFYCLVVGVLSTPVAYWAGYYDWQVKYRGAKAPIFTTKARYGIIMIVLGVVSVAQHILVPQTTVLTSPWLWLYAVMMLGQVGIAGLLGHLGGKLVYLH